MEDFQIYVPSLLLTVRARSSELFKWKRRRIAAWKKARGLGNRRRKRIMIIKV